ncbi:MAG: PorP/SprF family type IX secretion system membrane protein [Chitinophagaceae bacterium]|nr:PorP/SprF family type IX secretion system membrane protein [Chitinophagaceae bacterium]
MKKLILLINVAVLAGALQGQQLMTSSMYDQHGNLHNPATAGSAKHAMIGASYRKTWDGISGAPQTTLIFGSTYLKNAKIGIGGYLYNDVTGPTRRTGGQMAYSYHIQMANDATFSLGLEARLQQFSLDKAKLSATLGNDPVLASAESRFKADAGFGLAYNGKKLQVGASVSQLIQSKLDFYSGNLNPTEEGRLYRHYYLHGNYEWDVDGNTKIIPNLLFIYLPNAPLEVQGGARVEHNDVFWWGLGLRARQSWMISAGVKIQKKFTIGYCFDIFNTPLSVYDRGANGHEILLRYDFLK